MTTAVCPACGHEFNLIFDVAFVGHCERFCPACDAEITFALDWVPEVIEAWVGNREARPDHPQREAAR